MNQTFNIDGMTCNNCKASVEKYLNNLPPISHVSIDLAKGIADITTEKHLSAGVLQNALPEKFTVSEKGERNNVASTNTHSMSQEKSKLQQLKPLLLILFYISSAGVLLHYTDWSWREFMMDFMGLFYIVFAFFKMLDLKGFPESFKMYDPLAKRLPIYGWMYPFIETALGLMFLMRFKVNIALIMTLVILGITTIGVTKTLVAKKSIRCACLGTALKLPMTEATFIENSIMIAMAALMLFDMI